MKKYVSPVADIFIRYADNIMADVVSSSAISMSWADFLGQASDVDNADGLGL